MLGTLGRKKHSRLLAFAVLLVVSLTMNASATFSFSKTDSEGYYNARKVNDPSMAFSIETLDPGAGILEVGGDHNAPAPGEYAKVEVQMRFMAPEDCTHFWVAASWTCSYLLETNWPIGYATIIVYYVLYTDSQVARETHATIFQPSVNTPWWGGYHSVSDVYSMYASSYSIYFDWDLEENTYYRVAVQLYIYLDGEANAWSQAGYPNPVALDVSEIQVYD